MIRVVIAVGLTVALFGAAMPAIDTAQVDRTERVLQADLQAIDAAATTLADEEELTPPGMAGPQRVQTITLYQQTPTQRAVQRVTITRSELRYQLAEGPAGTVPLETNITTPGGAPLVFETPGTYQLRLELIERNGTRMVQIERGSPTH